MAKTGKAVVDLERSPIHLLHRALQLGLDHYGREVGAGRVSQRQFAVLCAVAADDGLSQSKLVKATGIDRSTIAELVSRMTQQGLLARRRTAGDARTNTVRLTDEGRATLAEIAPLAAKADRRLMKLLGAKKRDVFLTMLRKLVEESGPADGESEARPEKRTKAKKAKPPAEPQADA